LRETYAAIEQYRGDFTKLMLDNDLDALLCPPQVLITPKHDIPGKLFSAVSYTALFNLLDFGAGVVNVTKVKAEDEQKLLSDYPQTDVWYRKAKEACKSSHSHFRTRNTPLSPAFDMKCKRVVDVYLVTGGAANQ
ncbi:hypothetical protein ANCDUO_24159, partial [Ancylostoma duodenale]